MPLVATRSRACIRQHLLAFGVVTAVGLSGLLRTAIRTADEGALRRHLLLGSGLPGPRLNLRLVEEFAAAVGTVLDDPGLDVDRLEALLDGWAALSPAEAPGDQPEVILPCAAVAGYGAAAAARPEWWADEIGKLRAAASDPRWRVRELVAAATQRVLAANWDRTITAVQDWAAGPDPLLTRAAAAAVAEPALLTEPRRTNRATRVQQAAVATYSAIPPADRRGDAARALRQALGFTVSVVTAASGDFALLAQLAGAADPDLRWIARENLRKARLRRWPEQLAVLARE